MSAFDIVTENYFEDNKAKISSINIVTENYFDEDKINGYVVVFEESYGGKEIVKIFKEKCNAQKYLEEFSDELNGMVIKTDLPATNTVYITITEENYGGERSRVGVFETSENAERYAKHIRTNRKLNVLVIERQIDI